MDLDHLLSEIGEYGRYQKNLILFVILPCMFPCAFHAYNQLFMVTTPPNCCAPSLDIDHGNDLKAKNACLTGYNPSLIGIRQIESATKYHIWNTNLTKTLLLLYCLYACTILRTRIRIREGDEVGGDIIKAVLKEYHTLTRSNDKKLETEIIPSNKIDLDPMPYEELWRKEFLICETDYRMTLALVFFGISGFLGSYLFGYLQDRIGRKPSFFIYLSIECIFGIATVFAHNYWFWLMFRIGVGFTIPAIHSTPYVLPIELVGPTYRTRCTIYSNMAYSFGLVTLAGIVYVFRNWQYLALATSTPFLLFFIYWWYMPESPRWLLASGRFEEAVQTLKRIAKVNGNQLTNVQLMKLRENFAGEKTKILLQKSKQYGVKDLFQNKSLRINTIIISFIWFTNTSVYVGLSYYAPALSGDKYLNFFLAGVVELPTYIVLWPTMERYGRREILCLSMLVGGTACLMTSVTSDNQVVRALYCIGKMGISSSYVVLPLVTSELYPTVVRGTGMSIGAVAGMLGPVFIPIVNYLGLGSSLPIIIMGILLLSGGISSLFLPETKNMHLPETIAEYSN